jgi:carboxyl-terminal processing protease
MSVKRRLFAKKPNAKKCETCALISGIGIGIVSMLLFLHIQTPVLAASVRGFLAGETVSKDVIVQTTNRFEEGLSLVASLHHEQVTEEHMEEALAAAMGVFDRFNRPTPLKTEDAMARMTAPSMGYGWILGDGEDTLQVAYVVPGGPADKAGMKMGDVIVGVGPLMNAPPGVLRVALDKGLGEGPNAPIKLGVQRADEVQEVFFQKEMVKWPLARDYGVKDGVLRIAVMQFLPGVANQVRSIVDENVARMDIEGTPLLGVALDLRRNPGGLVDEADAMLEDWLDEGVVGYVMKGRTIKDRTFAAKEPQRWPQLSLAVLQNGASASCSEIVAGVLKETGRANVFGWRGVGKGSVQQSHPSMFTGAWSVTFAHYTVGEQGTVISDVGVVPNFEMSFQDDYDRPFPLQEDPVMDAVYAWMTNKK